MKNLKTFLLVISSILFTGTLTAANRYWIATATANWNSTANWSTTSGGAGGASVPGNADIAIFNAAKVGSCTINANVNVLGVTIVSGYTGTISQGTYSVSVGSSGFNQAAGTFSGGSGNITVGLFTLSGGTFTCSSGNTTFTTPAGNATIFTHSGGTFNHNNGIALFPANTSTAVYTVDVITATLFYKITANSGSGIGTNNSTVQSAANDTIKALNDFTHHSSTINGNWRVGGNLIVNTASNGGTGNIILFGTGNKTYSYTTGRTCNLIINKSSGTVTAAGGTTNFSVQGLKLIAGSFTSPSADFYIGGKIDASTTIFDQGSGTTFSHNSGTTIFDINGFSTYTIKTLSSTLFNHVTINSKGTQVLQNATDTLRVNNLTLTQGTFNTGIIQTKGNVIVTNTFGGTGKIAFMGTVDQNFTLTGATDKFNVTNLIIKQSPGKKVILQSAAILDQSGQSITFTRGNIVSTTTNLLTIGHGVTVNGMSNSSYVDGPMKKIGNAAFTFPVGKNGYYRKIGISAPAVTTDAYTAEFFNKTSNDLYTHSSKDGSIAALSRSEYWKLDRNTGTTNVSVTLSWDTATTSCKFASAANLKVASWDGSTWKDKGNGGTTGNLGVGTVVTNGVSTTYGAYTLATTASFNCKPGVSCSDAINLNAGNTCVNNVNMVGDEMWYSFVADSASLILSISYDNAINFGSIKSISIYSSCNTLINERVWINPTDSIYFRIKFYDLVPTNTYYVRLNRHNYRNDFSFNICKQLIGEKALCQLTPPPCELVRNGGFELLVNGANPNNYCTANNNPSQIDANMCDWSDAGGDCDLFSPQCNGINFNINSVATSPVYGNTSAFISAQLVGFISRHSILNNIREYVQTQLVAPLVANECYIVSAQFRRSDGATLSHATNNIGLLLSNTAVSANNFNVIPQCNSASLLTVPGVITNTAAWTQLNQVYVASGGEQFLTVGNFCTDAQTTITPAPNTNIGARWAYYFVDAVSVKKLANAGPDQIIDCNTASVQIGVCLDNTYTYSWVSNPAGFTSTNATPTVSPTVTTTYTLTVTAPGGCVATDQVTVTVLYPPVLSDITDGIICSGDCDQLTTSVSGGTTPISYAWISSPAGYTSSLPSPTVCPLVTTTYTLTVTDARGCTDQENVTVTVNPKPPVPIINGSVSACTTNHSYSITNAAGNTTYTWAAVSGTTTFTPSTGTSSTLTLDANGGSFTVTATNNTTGCLSVSTFSYYKCCTPEGNPDFSNLSVDDVVNDPILNDYITIGTGGVVQCQNVQSIYINGVFTIDRDFVFAFQDVLLGPDARIVIEDGFYLKINEGSHLHTCDSLYMWNGIYLDHPESLLEIRESLIEEAKNAIVCTNGAQLNINNDAVFNENYKGIVIQNYNNVQPALISSTSFTCNNVLIPPYSGTRSYAGIDIFNMTGSLVIGDPLDVSRVNTFDKQMTGIKVSRSNVEIYNNLFQNSGFSFGSAPKAGVWVDGNPVISGPNYTVTVGGNGTNESNQFNGLYRGVMIENSGSVDVLYNTFNNNTQAVYVYRNTSSNNINVNYNDITNSSTGIYCYRNPNTTIHIDNNTIHDMKNGSNGIILKELAVSNKGCRYTVYNNDITEVRRGIQGYNLSRPLIDNNVVEFIPQSSPSIPSKGIELYGNFGARVSNNIVYALPAHPEYATAGGIYLSLCSESFITCNIAIDAGYGIGCSGPMPSTVFKNTMNDNDIGFRLGNNGFIGIQDDPSTAGYPTYNRWNTNITYDTYTWANTDGSDSPFFVKFPPANQKPTNNAGAIPISFTISNSGTEPSCTYQISWGLVSGAHDIAEKSLTFPGNEDNALWLAQQALYFNIVLDSINVSSDTILNDFVDSVSAANLGELTLMGLYMEDPDAWGQMGQWQVSPVYVNDIEENMRAIWDMFGKEDASTTKLLTDTTNIDELRVLAFKCPYTDGLAVYQARAMLAPYDSAGTIYLNNCEIEDDPANKWDGQENTPEQQLTPEEGRYFKLYPNPNNGQMQLDYHLLDEENAVFTLIDMSGRVLKNYSLNSETGTLRIKEDDLVSGIYYYRINVNELTVLADKMIIIR